MVIYGDLKGMEVSLVGAPQINPQENWGGAKLIEKPTKETTESIVNQLH